MQCHTLQTITCICYYLSGFVMMGTYLAQINRWTILQTLNSCLSQCPFWSITQCIAAYTITQFCQKDWSASQSAEAREACVDRFCISSSHQLLQRLTTNAHQPELTTMLLAVVLITVALGLHIANLHFADFTGTPVLLPACTGMNELLAPASLLPKCDISDSIEPWVPGI